jgi:hypothetical protein
MTSGGQLLPSGQIDPKSRKMGTNAKKNTTATTTTGIIIFLDGKCPSVKLGPHI